MRNIEAAHLSLTFHHEIFQPQSVDDSASANYPGINLDQRDVRLESRLRAKPATALTNNQVAICRREFKIALYFPNWPANILLRDT